MCLIDLSYVKSICINRLLIITNSPYSKIVDKKSATLGLSMNRETPIGLNANHSSICKFGAIDDDDYEQVESNIIELAEKALFAAKEQIRQFQSSAPVIGGLGLASVLQRMQPQT